MPSGGAPVTLVNADGTPRAGNSSTNPSYSRSAGSPTIATNQVTVAATATQIVPARTGRGAVTIVNSGATDIFLGVSGVSVTTGVLLSGVKGASMTIPTSAAVFGIAATGTQVVSFLETYG